MRREINQALVDFIIITQEHIFTSCGISVKINFDFDKGVLFFNGSPTPIPSLDTQSFLSTFYFEVHRFLVS